MSTNAREMSDRELYEQAGLGHEFDAKYGKPLGPREFMELIKRREHRAAMGAGFNGSTKFVNFMLTLLGGLMLVGIVGGVVLYGQVQTINAKVDLIMQGRIK